MEIVNLNDYRPVEKIATLTLAKSSDGKLLIYPVWADENWIESHPNISARFRELQKMIEAASHCLEESAIEFQEPEP